MDTVSTLKVQVHTGVVHHVNFHQRLTTRKLDIVLISNTISFVVPFEYVLLNVFKINTLIFYFVKTWKDIPVFLRFQIIFMSTLVKLCQYVCLFCKEIITPQECIKLINK